MIVHSRVDKTIHILVNGSITISWLEDLGENAYSWAKPQFYVGEKVNTQGGNPVVVYIALEPLDGYFHWRYYLDYGYMGQQPIGIWEKDLLGWEYRECPYLKEIMERLND